MEANLNITIGLVRGRTNRGLAADFPKGLRPSHL